jgi:hypothetical protein
VAHISIQGNHIHLIVEAGDAAALESGMRALAISLAKRINRSLEREGKVFAFRYHSTALTSPRQTRNALSYVLNNWRRHNEDERGGLHAREMAVDPYSSALAFQGWSDFRLGMSPPPEFVELPPLPVSRAETWLLAVGWEKSNQPIRAWDTPGPIVARR